DERVFNPRRVQEIQHFGGDLVGVKGQAGLVTFGLYRLDDRLQTEGGLQGGGIKSKRQAGYVRTRKKQLFKGQIKIGTDIFFIQPQSAEGVGGMARVEVPEPEIEIQTRFRGEFTQSLQRLKIGGPQLIWDMERIYFRMLRNRQEIGK